MGYGKKINCGHPQFTEMCEIVILLHTTPFNNSEHHTIYKNLSVTGNWAVCGCVRVCDTSLDSSWHPHERMPGAQARPYICANIIGLLKTNVFYATLSSGKNKICLIGIVHISICRCLHGYLIGVYILYKAELPTITYSQSQMNPLVT